jgi:Flp pilus assembly pilin Flp
MLKKLGRYRLRKCPQRLGERGQGLVEYSLILVLAAVVVIMVLGFFGERIKNFYCEVVLSIAPNIDAPACNGVNATCHVKSVSPLQMTASASSLKGEKISKVVFFIDDRPYNTEYYVEYCLQGGDGPCDTYTGPRGKHTFTAVAYDAAGNSGKCSATVTVP